MIEPQSRARRRIGRLGRSLARGTRTDAASPPGAEVVAGACVLITGAARGMGEIYARKAVAQGARAVALWDIDGPRAEALARELSTAPGTEVRAFVVDISDLDAIRAGVAAVESTLGAPDILVNNAGIVRGAPFWEHDPERDIEGTMRVNALAPMWLTREVLPVMMADRGRAKRILTIASAAGTLPNPNMSVYAASKWAAIGWSESMRLELARAGHRHIAVTTFCPSYVSTGMFAGARGPLLTPIMTPEEAAAAAWNGMLAGTPVVNRPWTVKLAMAYRGVLPTRAWDFVADRVFHVYSSMDRFTGRQEAGPAKSGPAHGPESPRISR
nr:SDR family NAD(P)-dependent oxidoreductase [Nocardia zapadnayensis]